MEKQKKSIYSQPQFDNLKNVIEEEVKTIEKNKNNKNFDAASRGKFKKTNLYKKILKN